jgi:hypothetical protein
LERQQAEELRIQQELAEIERKKDYIRNGPDPELYDFGDKKYPVFKHYEHPRELHGYNKLSTLIPVGVEEQELPNGTKQQKLVSVELFRSINDPNSYYIGREVTTEFGAARFNDYLPHAWVDGHSPAFDINNHLGSKERPPVNVVISRDSNGRITMVSEEFIKDYEAGMVQNKFSDRLSGVEEPKPDVSAEMTNGYIYAQLHEKEYKKFCRKHKLNKKDEASKQAFFESQAEASKEVQSFRNFANDDTKTHSVIDENTILHKQYLKFRKRHANLSEPEARNQFALGYYTEMMQYTAAGKQAKFFKKYEKGFKDLAKNSKKQFIGG